MAGWFRRPESCIPRSCRRKEDTAAGLRRTEPDRTEAETVSGIFHPAQSDILSDLPVRSPWGARNCRIFPTFGSRPLKVIARVREKNVRGIPRRKLKFVIAGIFSSKSANRKNDNI